MKVHITELDEIRIREMLNDVSLFDFRAYISNEALKTKDGQKTYAHQVSFSYWSNPAADVAGITIAPAYEIMPDGSKRIIECSVIPAKGAKNDRS